MSRHPTYDQLSPLPAYAQRPVPMPFEDLNGHLNVRHYLGIASEGIDESLTSLGVPMTWPLSERRAALAAEHHCIYLAPLVTGDSMSVRVRMLGRSERAAHAIAYLLDDTNRRVASVIEEIFLHVELDPYVTAPWPTEVAAALDERVAEHNALGFDSAVSGSLKLR